MSRQGSKYTCFFYTYPKVYYLLHTFSREKWIAGLPVEQLANLWVTCGRSPKFSKWLPNTKYSFWYFEEKFSLFSLP